MPNKEAHSQYRACLDLRGVIIQEGRISICPYSFASERRRRHRSEQYFTSSQFFSHFLRQVKGNPQTGHTFVGKSDLERARPMIERMVKWVDLSKLERTFKSPIRISQASND